MTILGNNYKLVEKSLDLKHFIIRLLLLPYLIDNVAVLLQKKSSEKSDAHLGQKAAGIYNQQNSQIFLGPAPLALAHRSYCSSRFCLLAEALIKVVKQHLLTSFSSSDKWT